MTTITVSSQAEAQEAYLELAANGGGTILLAAGTEPYALSLRGNRNDDNNAPIEIRPADPNGDLVLKELWLTHVENVTVRGVNVDTSDIPNSETRNNFEVRGSDGVRILDSTFNSRATAFMDRDQNEEEKADTFGSFFYSTNVEFSGNTVSNYFHGLGLFETTDAVVSDNEIFGIQADGIRMGSVQRVEIDGNYLHDFYGSPNGTNHDDMIQLWSAGARMVTEDLSITNNILNAGNGAASQSIFIGNERDTSEADHVYQNITVSDNLIINGHTNGVIVSGTKNAVVQNNTLLWNKTAQMYSSGDHYDAGDGTNGAPGIRVTRIEGGEISGNITKSIYINGTINEGENKIIELSDVTAENYVGNFFLNEDLTGVTEGGDLRLAPGNALNGFGASASQVRSKSDGEVEAVLALSTAADDFNTLLFDARYSVDGDGYLDQTDTFLWRFSDGTTAQGIVVEKTFAESGMQSADLEIRRDGQVVDTLTRDFNIADKRLVELTFETGIVDSSSYESSLSRIEEGNLVAANGGQAYRIGGSQKLQINRGNDQIHNLETFGIRLDMQVNAATAGTFLYFHKVFQGSISDEGIVTFRIETDAGTYKVSSDRALFQDGQFHTLGIGFDGENGALELVYDGETVGETAAFGITAGLTSYGIVLGHSFGTSLPAVIDSFVLDADPEEAGVVVEKTASTINAEPIVAASFVPEPIEEEAAPAAAAQDVAGVSEAASVISYPQSVLSPEPVQPLRIASDSDADAITPENGYASDASALLAFLLEQFEVAVTSQPLRAVGLQFGDVEPESVEADAQIAQTEVNNGFFSADDFAFL